VSGFFVTFSPVVRLPRGMLVALFVVACATLPVALLGSGSRGAFGREAIVLEQAKGRLLLRTYGKPVAAALVPCPPQCVYFAVFCLLLTPAATLVITALRRPDHDEARGKARLARSFGELGAHAGRAIAVVAASYALMGLWFAFAGNAHTALRWMPRLFLVNALYAVPFVGLATALRALSSSTVIAFGAHGVVLGLLAVLHGIVRVRQSPLAEYLPGAVDGLLLSADPASVLRGAGLALSWAVLFGVIAAVGSTRNTEEELR
jgi:hypothetical protein